MKSSLDLEAFTFVCEVNLDNLSPPFRSMRALRLQWSWAFSLVCEVALSCPHIGIDSPTSSSKFPSKLFLPKEPCYASSLKYNHILFRHRNRTQNRIILSSQKFSNWANIGDTQGYWFWICHMSCGSTFVNQWHHATCMPCHVTCHGHAFVNRRIMPSPNDISCHL